MNRLFNYLMFLPFQIVWKMVIGLTRVPGAKPLEILFVIIFIVIVYASAVTKEYNITLISGSILGFYLMMKGWK